MTFKWTKMFAHILSGDLPVSASSIPVHWAFSLNYCVAINLHTSAFLTLSGCILVGSMYLSVFTQSREYD